MSETLYLPSDEAFTHKDTIVRSYIESLDEADYAQAGSIAEQLHDSALALSDHLILVPVEASADSRWIPQALGQYARQAVTEPFTVVLGINVDAAAHVDTAEILVSAENIVNAARADHSTLDVRSSFTSYNSPSIGRIRRDLWNGALLAKLQSGNFSPTKEVIGLNHDIDLVHLPKYYLASVQHFTQDPLQALWPFYTQILHAHDAEHPNISGVVYWADFLSHILNSGYEAAAGLPMTYYAARGGIEASRRTHEIGSFISWNHEPTLVRTGYLHTLPRRFVARLDKHGFGGIWTDENFSTQDDCRRPDLLAAMPDMASDKVQDMLAFSAEASIEEYSSKLVGRILNDYLQYVLDNYPMETISVREATRAANEILLTNYRRFERLARFAIKVATPIGYTPPAIGTDTHLEKLQSSIDYRLELFASTLQHIQSH